jgi:hypothetical protein
MFQTAFFACADFHKVGSSLRKAQGIVRPTPDQIGILVVLSIIFPEAYGTDVESTPFGQCFISAAWTGIQGTVFTRRLVNTLE